MEGYDDLQLREIRLAKEYGIDIDPYLSVEFYGAQIREIRLGVEDEVDVSIFATGEYTWKQMHELRVGLEEHLDVSFYCRPLMNDKQMEQVRLGLEAELDVSSYAQLLYSASEMKKLRLQLLEERAASQLLADEAELNAVIAMIDEAAAEEVNLDIPPVQLSIDPDKMQVMMELYAPGADEVYTKKQLMDILQENGIKQGIDEKQLQRMIDEKIYYEKICIAKGRERIDGCDGYFVYEFRTDLPVIPKKQEDGSVDFREMDLFEPVHKGQLLATYHKATSGQYGYNVYGELLVPRKGKDLPPLRGEGFLLSEDRLTYVAALDGKAELTNNQYLQVTKVMVIKGDVDYGVGNIHFDGDVNVLGDVRSGFTIQATGNVQIKGHVEKAVIISGGNVAVQSGMNGAGGGKITAGGSVYGSYFEESMIYAGAGVQANYILNSEITCGDKVIVSGQKGVIIGGSIQALHGVESFSIGNSSQTLTRVAIGVTDAILDAYQGLTVQKVKIKQQLDILQEGQKKFVGRVMQNSPKAMEMYLKVQQAIGIKESEMKKCEEERARLQEEIDGAANSRVTITGVAYAGVVVRIDRRELKLNGTVKNVYFATIDNHVGIIKLR